jgi:peptidase M28-like protein
MEDSVRFRVAALCLLFLSVAALAQKNSKTQAPGSTNLKLTVKISPDALRGHVRFLADDLLEGRGTATRGHEIAAKYVAGQFEEMGLKPGGDQGTYFQRVPFRQAIFQPAQSSVVLAMNGTEQPLRHEDDYLTQGDFLRTDTTAQGPVVFVGFGVVAPELNHDDYKGVDVKDKIVAVFPGAPAKWESTQRAYYSSTYLKGQAAAQHGAIGVITIWNPEIEKRAPWPRMIRQNRLPALRTLAQEGQPLDTYPQLRGSIILSLAKGRELFKAANHDLDQVYKDAEADNGKSFELPFTAKLHLVTEHKETSSPNVVAILPGSDPKLKDEYVVLSAHLDHLGIGTPVKGDSIYNGAFDNASGSAALMEIARAFTKLSTAPKRSLIFLNDTGEEKGLQGAYYFAFNPTVPLEKIVGNINMDELNSFFPLKDVVGFGAEHTSMKADLDAAAKTVGYQVSPDPFPEETIFIRSDQFPFVRRGIPAIFVTPGLTSSDPKIDGKAIYEDWLKNRYHSPQDDTSQPFDWKEGARLATLDFLITQRVANAPQRPSWNKGDFFGEKFASKSSALK